MGRVFDGSSTAAGLLSLGVLCLENVDVGDFTQDIIPSARSRGVAAAPNTLVSMVSIAPVVSLTYNFLPA